MHVSLILLGLVVVFALAVEARNRSDWSSKSKSFEITTTKKLRKKKTTTTLRPTTTKRRSRSYESEDKKDISCFLARADYYKKHLALYRSFHLKYQALLADFKKRNHALTQEYKKKRFLVCKAKKGGEKSSEELHWWHDIENQHKKVIDKIVKKKKVDKKKKHDKKKHGSESSGQDNGAAQPEMLDGDAPAPVAAVQLLQPAEPVVVAEVPKPAEVVVQPQVVAAAQVNTVPDAQPVGALLAKVNEVQQVLPVIVPAPEVVQDKVAAPALPQPPTAAAPAAVPASQLIGQVQGLDEEEKPEAEDEDEGPAEDEEKPEAEEEALDGAASVDEVDE